MARIIWSAPALIDIEAIAAYVRQVDPAASRVITANLIVGGDSLADFPNRGRPRARGIREFTRVWPYVIRYQVAGDTVRILGIRHGARLPLVQDGPA